MTDNKKTFYENQKILIDLALKILEKEMPKFQGKFSVLFYDKKIPPHISQPLQALKNKITFKPLFEKIEKELGISHRRAKKLVETYGFSYVLNNLEKLKPLKNKSITEKMTKKIIGNSKQKKLFFIQD